MALSLTFDTLSEVALFFEKIHKVFKNKVQGYSTLLKAACGLTKVQSSFITEFIGGHDLVRLF